MTLKSDAKFEEKLTLVYKCEMRNLVNFNLSSGKSEICTMMCYFFFERILCLSQKSIYVCHNIELCHNTGE